MTFPIIAEKVRYQRSCQSRRVLSTSVISTRFFTNAVFLDWQGKTVHPYPIPAPILGELGRSDNGIGWVYRPIGVRETTGLTRSVRSSSVLRFRSARPLRTTNSAIQFADPSIAFCGNTTSSSSAVVTSEESRNKCDLAPTPQTRARSRTQTPARQRFGQGGQCAARAGFFSDRQRPASSASLSSFLPHQSSPAERLRNP